MRYDEMKLKKKEIENRKTDFKSRRKLQFFMLQNGNNVAVMNLQKNRCDEKTKSQIFFLS